MTLDTIKPLHLALAACCLVAAATSADPGTGQAVEVCAPGRGGDMFGEKPGDVETLAVLDLVPFDGRLYIRLATTDAEEPPPVPILAYDPERMDIGAECRTRAPRTGRMRVLDDTLHVPACATEGNKSGYFTSDGGGKWRWVEVSDSSVSFHDIARFDGKTFLAGRREDLSVVFWQQEGGDQWNEEILNQQAARFSLGAMGFLPGPDHLSVMALRTVVGDWPVRVAPRDWGAWYCLHYFPEGSVRGFIFDGQARQIPVLRALAPGAGLIQSRNHGVASDSRWGDGLLYLISNLNGMSQDERGCLYEGRIANLGPLVGKSWAARRVPGMEDARDVSVVADVCTVLLVRGMHPRGKIVRSKDLESWQTVFEGEFPGIPVSMAVLNGETFVGTANGAIVKCLAEDGK